MRRDETCTSALGLPAIMVRLPTDSTATADCEVAPVMTAPAGARLPRGAPLKQASALAPLSMMPTSAPSAVAMRAVSREAARPACGAAAGTEMAGDTTERSCRASISETMAVTVLPYFCK